MDKVNIVIRDANITNSEISSAKHNSSGGICDSRIEANKVIESMQSLTWATLPKVSTVIRRFC